MSLKLCAKLLVIIYLTIEGYGDSTVLAEHRLVPRSREVNNAESPLTESAAIVGSYPYSAVIWPTMNHSASHIGYDMPKFLS
jgi:hypothetical protein